MKNIALSVLMILVTVLSACSSSPPGASDGLTQSNNTLSIEAQLVVGTLKLEGTQQDVTVEQARELIVLWQVYDEISQSDTAAQGEIDGLIEQIQDNMMSEQMQAITDLQLTQQDVITAAQGLTIASNSSQSDSSISNVAFPDAGMAAGAPPDGGGASLDGGGMPADFGGAGQTINTGQADVAQALPSMESSLRIPPALVQALIQALEQKITA